MSSFRKYKHHTLWATTAYQQYRIQIYINRSPKFGDTYDGMTWDSTIKGERILTIEISEEVSKDPRFFQQTLIHEFTHVLEYCNPSEEFSTQTVNGCTALARTIGHGLSQMLTELRQVGV